MDNAEQKLEICIEPFYDSFSRSLSGFNQMAITHNYYKVGIYQYIDKYSDSKN